MASTISRWGGRGRGDRYDVRSDVADCGLPICPGDRDAETVRLLLRLLEGAPADRDNLDTGVLKPQGVALACPTRAKNDRP